MNNSLHQTLFQYSKSKHSLLNTYQQAMVSNHSTHCSFQLQKHLTLNVRDVRYPHGQRKIFSKARKSA